MLTDVEKAIVQLKMMTDMFDDLRGGHNCAAIHMDVLDQRALYTAIKALKEARPHGEWNEELASFGYVDLKCSVCGCLCECVECGKQYNFCPNCGADMRKEGEAE